MKLNEITDNPGAHKKRVRIGRGIGSGKGKTSGRGQKGQGSRSSVDIPTSFEGGQMPLAQRLPKLRGFTNINRLEFAVVNLGKLFLPSLKPQEGGDAGKQFSQLEASLESLKIDQKGAQVSIKGRYGSLDLLAKLAGVGPGGTGKRP